MRIRLAARRPKSTREQTADVLRNAIVSGELKPGQRLFETDIAEQLGISRAPVREALRQLEQEGLIVSTPYRETRVATTSEVEIQEVLLPIRSTLEIFALRRIMAGNPAEAIAVLQPIVETMREAAAANDRTGVAEADIEFHKALIHLAGHPHPIRIWNSIASLIRGSFLLAATKRGLDHTVAGHDELLRAMAAGEVAPAEALLQQHMEEMVE